MGGETMSLFTDALTRRYLVARRRDSRHGAYYLGLQSFDHKRHAKAYIRAMRQDDLVIIDQKGGNDER